MAVRLLLFWEHAVDQALAPGDLDRLRVVLAALPGLSLALIHTPARAQDCYVDDGPGPALGLELAFADIGALEAAAGLTGGLQQLFAPGVLSGLAPQRANAGAFLVRDYPVEAPQHAPQARPCSYVVHYPGRAADPNGWLACYIAGHPPLLRRLAGIRAIEILTPVDWVNHLPVVTAPHMLRNRVLFDSPEALTTALQAPVRHELRAEFDVLPAFDGGSIHHAMLTETCRCFGARP